MNELGVQWSNPATSGTERVVGRSAQTFLGRKEIFDELRDCLVCESDVHIADPQVQWAASNAADFEGNVHSWTSFVVPTTFLIA